MSKLCGACDYREASIFYIWLPGSVSYDETDNIPRCRCHKCWENRAYKLRLTVEEYTADMDSGSTRVFYTYEDAQLAIVKAKL